MEKHSFKIVVRVGSLPGYPNQMYTANLYNGHPHKGTALDPLFGPSIYCAIEYRYDSRTDKGVLSISGVIGPRRDGESIGGAGQICMEFAHRNPARNDARTARLIYPDDIRFAEGWDRKRWLTFLAIWDRWHMNDASPACIHQRRLGWNTERIDPSRPSTDYDKFDGKLRTWNLKGWVHAPLGYLAEPCPVCGFKYGTKWVYEPVPESVLSWIKLLPDSDRMPAWV